MEHFERGVNDASDFDSVRNKPPDDQSHTTDQRSSSADLSEARDPAKLTQLDANDRRMTSPHFYAISNINFYFRMKNEKNRFFQ